MLSACQSSERCSRMCAKSNRLCANCKTKIVIKKYSYRLLCVVFSFIKIISKNKIIYVFIIFQNNEINNKNNMRTPYPTKWQQQTIWKIFFWTQKIWANIFLKHVKQNETHVHYPHNTHVQLPHLNSWYKTKNKLRNNK